MNRPKLTKEERRQRVEALLGLIDEVEKRPDYPGVIGIAADLFPGYSVKNQALILGQRADARQVAGFHAWKALGRKVKKGAKGIAILVPMTRGQSKEARDADAQEGLTGTKDRMFFGTGYVFDIADTEPFEEGEHPEPIGDRTYDLGNGETATIRTTYRAVIDANGFREIPVEGGAA